MKVIYVAGPFRAASSHVPGHQDMFRVQQHIMRAMELSLEIWRMGAVALCPHANSMFFTGSALDDVWLKGDLELLDRCDAIAVTSNWVESSGARAEVDYAVANNIPVLYTPKEVENYIYHGFA